ncbi:MAG: NAD(P)/FAD-dependent oxidoreductase [Acidimicrobiaceae bacterium]
MDTASSKHVDVVVVGAGLSGIGAACHLMMQSPSRTFAILESRNVSGGTWDLFRYPAVRSDSDMYTLGYSFAPWREKKSIADGPLILNYIRETAEKFGVEERIQYNRRVVDAKWSSETALWTLTIKHTDSDTSETMTCNFLWGNTGYYTYDKGYRPDFPGEEKFQGTLIHPQHWPENLDYKDKTVVVIGSGATAMTIVPAMAKEAAKVVLLQRSPTYVVARPDVDEFADKIRAKFSPKLAHKLIRFKTITLGMLMYQLSQKKPDLIKRRLREGAAALLPEGYDVDTHFNPTYNPWDQRLCLVPNGDLFTAISSGKAEIVTDTIESFTSDGILLTSGKELKADIIVTATGLVMQLLGGMSISVDGVPVDLGKTVSYKGIMLSGVPNLGTTFGYTNASWTLKADLTADYICRLLNKMEKLGVRQATPKVPADQNLEPTMGLTSGYVMRAQGNLPLQATKKPWKLYQNFALDTMLLKHGKIDNEMEFSNAKKR